MSTADTVKFPDNSSLRSRHNCDSVTLISSLIIRIIIIILIIHRRLAALLPRLSVTHIMLAWGSFHSINKLQNDIILLIFKIWKFENIRFVGNLIEDIHWNFYDDDVITVTSLVLSQSVSQPVQYFAGQFSFLLQHTSVKLHCKLR